MSSIPLLEALSLGADAAYLSKRGLPIAPDGQYDWEHQADNSRSPQGHAALTNLINTIERIKPKGTGKPDPRVVGAFLDAAVHPGSVDDRKGVFADGIELLSHLPPQAGVTKQLSDAAITLLYETVPHPPAASLGPTHTFRQADGGGNNLQDPDLGRAGTPYARSVQGQNAVPLTALPDPGLVFDTLMRARDRKDHPAGNSSLTFAFATLVTHSLFRTDQKDWNINQTSSYLDLSPLYGTNQAAQDLYIADMLLKINERGRWTDPPSEDHKIRAQQDEEIFQTARLVNGFLGNLGLVLLFPLGSYILNKAVEGITSPMFDNALGPIKGRNGPVARGEGNQCSVEFNVIYRTFQKVFGQKSLEELTLQELGPALARVAAGIDPDPSKRTFGGISRGKDGKFSDDDIAKILQDATENPAGAFRARGTTPALRVVEILGIMQARQWGRFESFEEWNPDPEIASAARRLYGHIDSLELYLMRAVLADAIALVRGDRYYTTDFTRMLIGSVVIGYANSVFVANNLTAWGYEDCQRDPHNGGLGGESLGGGYGFFLAFDEALNKILDTIRIEHGPFHTLFPSKSSLAEYRAWYRDSVIQKISERSWKYDGVPGNYIDIVKSVINATSVHWAADVLVIPIYYMVCSVLKILQCGIHLKTKENPKGLYTEEEVYGHVHSLDSEHGFSSQWAATQAGTMVQALVAKTVLQVAPESAPNALVKFLSRFSSYLWPQSGKPWYPFMSRLAATGRPMNELVANVMGIAVGSSVNYAQGACFALRTCISGSENSTAAVHVIDFYLDDARQHERAQILKLVHLNDEKSTDLLRGYVREAMRKYSPMYRTCGVFTGMLGLNPQYGGLWRDVVEGCGDRIWASFKNAQLNYERFVDYPQPSEFPHPTSVDPQRPVGSYTLNGTGFPQLPWCNIRGTNHCRDRQSRVRLKNVRRAPGNDGHLAGFKTIINETETHIYLTPYGTTSPWPGSMYLVYDD
ncbi:heme peroxidase [Mycena olivaceomarginata]|nr:heme peroxidase [Mycena olivaceomarginata]